MPEMPTPEILLFLVAFLTTLKLGQVALPAGERELTYLVRALCFYLS